MFAKSCVCLAAVLAVVTGDVRSLYRTPDPSDGAQANLLQSPRQGPQTGTPLNLPTLDDQTQSGKQATEDGNQQLVGAGFGGQQTDGGVFSSGQSFGGQQTDGGVSLQFGSQQGGASSAGPLMGVSGVLPENSGPAPRIINLQPSQLAGTDGDLLISAGSPQAPTAQVTITKEVTIDRFTTLTNLAYNSVPVTLTEFLKVTVTAPTFEVVTTPVDDMVLVSRVPVSRTDTITVTDTNSGHQYATEVSTVLHTITHKLYDIRQQTVTSLVVQTQLVRPRIVSTHIETEYDTQTVSQTVTNTVFLDSQVSRSGPVPARLPSRYGFYQ